MCLVRPTSLNLYAPLVEPPYAALSAIGLV